MFVLPLTIFLIYQPPASFQERATFDMSKVVVSGADTVNDSVFFIQDRLVDNLERLEDIAKLEADWNGYGAEPFSSALVDVVRNIILSLNEQPEIFPTGRKSIQLEYHEPKDNYLEFEVFESQVVAMQVYGTDYDNAQFWDFPSNDTGQIRRIVERFVND